METTKLKDVPKGDFVRRVRKDGSVMNKTYIKGEYDRSSKKYAIQDCNDVWGSGVLLKGDTLVTTDFTY